jgi:hypothetical protein
MMINLKPSESIHSRAFGADAYDDMCLNERTLEPLWSNDIEEFVITKEWDLANQINRLLKTTVQVLKLGESQHFFLNRRNESVPRRVGTTKLGKEIHYAFQADDVGIREHFHTHQFHPLIELSLDLGEKHVLFDASWKIKAAVNDEAEELVTRFNRFVDALRVAANAYSFKKNLRNFQRSSTENLCQFNRYISAHFAKRSNLLFVRLEIGYSDAYLSALNRDMPTVYKKIKRDWKIFYSDLNQRILKTDLCGYVWKLEYGLNRSFHLHVLLIVDCSESKSDIEIGKLVGDHWKETVTGGRGSYFKCSSNPSSFRFSNIGQIHREDTTARQNLSDRVGLYVTKPDYFVALRTPDSGRTFGKGVMPR